MPANEVIIQRLKSGQLIVTIPRAIAELKGWKKGTKLVFKEDRFGTVTIMEVSN
jgi:bifunctional DNA-binding transcriptional regulator/antitoxin component of YhaV-PrlF toxin-antitoxin module